MKISTLIIAGLFLLMPSIAKAQDNGKGTVGTHGDGSSAAINAPNRNAPSPAAHATADGRASTVTSGNNDGSYVESKPMDYDAALAEGKKQQAELAKPKTFAEQVKEAQAQKGADKKAKTVITELPKAK